MRAPDGGHSVGSRVYDSENGITCHWCRQKTVETHIKCTAHGCGGRGRAPITFCGMCLRNRHGKDTALRHYKLARSGQSTFICARRCALGRVRFGRVAVLNPHF